ncbi:MAG: permease [Bacteroidales bacterium]
MDWIRRYFDELYYLSSEMAPYLLLGFIFAGILHVYIRRDKIVRLLGKGNLRSVVNAALIGIPLPLCSCGVIPTGIAFHRDGASKPATVSFLISTPQTGVDSILVTWSLLGWPMAVIRPVVALLTGVIGGGVTMLRKRAPKEEEVVIAAPAQQEKGPRWLTMLRYAFIDFMEDIAKWLLIGLLLAALMAVIIPDGFFTNYIHNPWLSMLMVLVASVPLYVCATGSVPIAAVLMMKGLSPGAALVFLMAGPATNIATITVIGKTLGKWALFAYLASIIGGALFFGFLTDKIFTAGYLFSMMDHVQHAHEHELIPGWIKLISLIILAIFIFYALLIRYRIIRRKPANQKQFSGNMKKIAVTGMTCNHCKTTVENAVKAMPGVTGAEADIQAGVLSIESSDPDLVKIREKIESLGYGFLGEVKD